MSKFNKSKLVRVDLYIGQDQNTFLNKHSEEMFLSKSIIMRLALNEYIEKIKNKDIK